MRTHLKHKKKKLLEIIKNCVRNCQKRVKNEDSWSEIAKNIENVRKSIQNMRKIVRNHRKLEENR